MLFQVLTIEHHVTRPNRDVGDCPMSPVMRRVSAACPVMHLLGHVHLPPAAATAGGSGHPAATEGATTTPAPPHWQELTACLHVHGVYPYFYVPQANSCISAEQFAAQLETISLRRLFSGGGGADGGEEGGTSTAALRPPAHGQIIHDVELVARTPFYGYHREPCAFFKVSYIDPSHYPRLQRLLQETTEVGGRQWPVLEGHISYTSQLMIDYDIKGMTPFPLARGDVQVRLPTAGRLRRWYGSGLPTASPFVAADVLPRQTTCEVEMDIAVATLAARTTEGHQSGEHLLSVRRLMKAYFAEHGVPDALRVAGTIHVEEAQQERWRGREGLSEEEAAKSSFFVRRGTVSQIQRQDPVACALRRQMEQYLEAREQPAGVPRRPSYLGCEVILKAEAEEGTGIKEEAHAAVAPGEAEEAERASPLTYEVLDQLRDGAPPSEFRFTPFLSLPSQQTSTPAPRERQTLMGEKKDDDAEEAIEEELLLSSASSLSVPQRSFSGTAPGWGLPLSATASHERAFQVGDHVAFMQRQSSAGLSAGGSEHTFTLLYAARITALSETSVHLRWLLPLSETVFADEARALERRGCWEPASAPTAFCCGELLLGVRAEENPSVVLSPLRVELPVEEGGSSPAKRMRALVVVPCLLHVYVGVDAYRRAAAAAQAASTTQTAAVALCRYLYNPSIPRAFVPLPEEEKAACMRSRAPDGAAPTPRHAAEEAIAEQPFCTQRGSVVALPEQLCDGAAGRLRPTRACAPRPHGESDSRKDPGEMDEEGEEEEESELLHTEEEEDEDEEEKEMEPLAPGRTDEMDERNKTHARLLSKLPFRRRTVTALCAASQRPTSAAATQPSGWPASSQDSSLIVVSPSVRPPPPKPQTETTASLVPSTPSVQAVDAVHAELLRQLRRNASLTLRHSRAGGDVDGLLRRFILYKNTNSAGEAEDSTVHVRPALWPERAVALPSSLTPPAPSLDETPEREAPVASSRGGSRAGPGLYTRVCAPLAERRTLPPPAPPPRPQTTPSSSSAGGTLSHSTSSSSLHESMREFRLRVMTVEVLIGRRPGDRRLHEGELLAVGLGRSLSSSADIQVHLFAVATAGAAPRQYALSDGVTVTELRSETVLLRRVVREIHRHDPDLLLSWEGYKYGLGLLAQRYRLVLGRSLRHDLSRFAMEWAPSARAAPTPKRGREEGEEEEDGELRPQQRVSTEAQDEPRLSAVSGGSGSVPEEEAESDADPNDEGDDKEEDGEDGDTGAPKGKGRGKTFSPQYTRRFGVASFAVLGRVCVSLSRDLRKQRSFAAYNINVVYESLCGGRLPYLSDVRLTELYSGGGAERWTALQYLCGRVVAPHRVAVQFNYYTRQSQFSRMYGILFAEVASRGSQFRVEATLVRMTRPLHYVLYSPTREQVHRQPRIQVIPLVMQPKSGYYTDPVVVLDFRSLYPSIVIAYNLCYSTCVGLVHPQADGRLGVLPHFLQDSEVLRTLVPDSGSQQSSGMIFAPNGAMFLPAGVQEGVLPRMMRLVLDTRFEVQAASQHVAGPLGDEAMLRQLREQQLALKMVANVTYGYVAASFTGRMPCVDIAEAIVSLSRQTLERAVAQVRGHARWAAQVVYGDTDSLFVRLPGRTVAEAFTLGEEMARAVSAANPSPVVLQFEKVLCPCLLLVKKRYTGYAWSSPTQAAPTFLAKGIETVRRDQCPAAARIAETILRALFDGASPPALRQLYETEVSKLQRGDCNPIDYIFRRAVKLDRYQNVSHMPLGAHLALQLMAKDLARTPYWGERLPYVVVRSTVSGRLRDQVRHPDCLLRVEDGEEPVTLDAEYYIYRHVNPILDRFLYLLRLSAARWYSELPRRRTRSAVYMDRERFLRLQREQLLRYTPEPLREEDGAGDAVVDVDEDAESEGEGEGRGTILVASGQEEPAVVRRQPRTLDGYYPRTLCIVCERGTVTLEEQQTHFRQSSRAPHDLLALPPICGACWADPAELLGTVMARYASVGRRLDAVQQTCASCLAGHGLLTGDVEDLQVRTAVPRHLALTAAGPGLPESCTSVDCAVNFEKTRLTLLFLQLQMWQQYLREVLGAPPA